MKIVTNAGGLNPAGSPTALREIAGALGLRVNVAHVEGDDLCGSALAAGGVELPALALTANAYLGGCGIAAALDAGAHVVVTGRVTDASLVVGPAASGIGWARDDTTSWPAPWSPATSSSAARRPPAATSRSSPTYPDIEHVGFPVAEIAADGSSVITKHDGTGGLVTSTR